MSSPVSLSRPLPWLLAAAIALIWCANLDHRVLQHPDEGRYAEIAREMAASGDWITPRLSGFKYFEKPPLQYWLTASLFRVFGPDEWTARLVPVLAGLAAVLVIAWIGTRLGGPPLGWSAGLLLAGTVWHVMLSQVVSLDALLSALLTGAFAAFVVAQTQAAGVGQRRRLMLVAWVCVALATLTKGPVAIVIPGGALALYVLVQRDATVLGRLHPVAGIAALATIAAPWFVAVSIANPEFARFFFVHEHFERYLTTTHHRIGEWWYFLPLLLAGGMPWLPMLAAALPLLWRGDAHRMRKFAWQRFALCWAAFVFLFFSASGSKLPSYILPMFPPLALAAAWGFLCLPIRRLAALALIVAMPALALALAATFAFAPIARPFTGANQPFEAVERFAPWLRAGLAVAAVSGIGAFALLRRGDAGRLPAIAALSLGTLLTSQLVVAGMDSFRGTRSSYDILREAQRALGSTGNLRAPDVPFYQIHMHEQTAPFYLGRTTTPVEFRDELAPGIDAEPGKAFSTVAEWRPTWDALPQGYALVPVSDFDVLAADGIPMRVLARDTRRVVVSRR